MIPTTRKTPHDARQDPGIDGVLPQRRSNRPLLHDLQGSRQGTGTKDQSQVPGLLHGGVGKLDLTRGSDPVTDDGCAHDLAVQDDGQELPHVGAGDLGETPPAPAVQLKVDHGPVELGVTAGNGVLQHVTGNERLGLEDVEAPVGAGADPHGIGSPLQGDVPGDGPTNLREGQEALGCLHVGFGHEVDPFPVPLIQQGGEGSQLQGRCLGGVGQRLGPRGIGQCLGLHRVGRTGGRVGAPEEELLQALGGSFRHPADLPEGVLPHGCHNGPVDARQRRLDPGRGEDELELQEGVGLDESLGPSRVLDARKLDDEAILSDPLDQGLLNPELIDPGSDDALRTLDVIRPGLHRHGVVGIVHFQDQVHPTLEIEAVLDPIGEKVAKGTRHQDDDEDDSTSYGLEHRLGAQDAG
jgi:hypothetical protein